MAGRPTPRRSGRARRRAAGVALAIISVAGLAAASAAQLTVTSGTLGAGTAVVGSCQPAGQVVGVRFTSTFTSGAYRTTQVVLTNVNAACNNLTYRLRLTDGAGNPVGTEVTSTVVLTGTTLTVPISSTPSASIAGVAVVIHS